jgi:4-methylaminobutanoate oxidase (formaldehyde-forming)
MHMRREKGAMRVEITDVTSGWAIIGLAGARAQEVLKKASAAPLPALKPFGFAPVEVGLARGFVGRLSYTGQAGFELYFPAEMAMAAHEALVTAGASHAGLFASGSLRIEAGFRAWGHELTQGTTPFEAGFERFCAFDTDFIGKAALADHVPQRQIATVLFDSADAIPIHDEPIWFDGQVAGQITSAAWNYAHGRTAALAMLKMPLDRLRAGEIVGGFEIEIACKRFSARAALAPLKDWKL